MNTKPLQLQTSCGYAAAQEPTNRVTHSPLTQPVSYSNRSSSARRRSEPGNNLGSARKIPGTAGSYEYKNSVSLADPDFYRLRLSKPMMVRATATNLGGNAISFAFLQQSTGLILSQNAALSVGQKNRSFPTRLTAGTYIVRIESPSRSRYRLAVSIKPSQSGSSDNDSSGDFSGGNSSGDYFGNVTCSDFTSQWQAQAYLSSNPGLDGDGDGIACEALPSYQ